ncbi:MAG: P-II family nitrogen regulator [Limnochordales bacterium]|nr:transcriptional regulator [Bacillota bacterium]REJ31896.1 MAG: transcriptional regulator [Bacillota bacterium]
MGVGQFDVIVVIVASGVAEEALEAARRAGAEGATILHGRGSGIHEQKKIFNIPIEPEKDILIMLVPRQKTEGILAAVDQAVDLNKPGHGIAFVLEVKSVIGLSHPVPGADGTP